MSTVSLKPDFAKVEERYAAWWENKSLGDRPIVCAREILKPGAPPQPGANRPRGERELDVKWQMANAEWTLAAYVRPADTLPYVNPEFGNGISLPVAFIGAKLNYQPLTTWVEEMPDIYERDLPDFSASDPIFGVLNESLKQMGKRFGDKALLTVPYLSDSLTSLALLRGAEKLCVDLVDRPDDVKRVVAHLDKVAIDAHKAFWKTMEELGHNESVTWADVYYPGKCEMLQSDFSVNISPAMFDEFVMPSLKLWSEYLDHGCYHLDGAEQYRFMDRLRSLPGIQSIQWQPGDMNKHPMKYLDYLKDIRKRGLATWVMAFDTEEPVKITEAMGPDGLMFYLRDVQSMEEFDRMMERLEEVCRRKH